MLIETVSQVIHRHTLIDPNAILVVGVSGGADSLALLHSLIALGYTRLHVATLDHGLRREAGADDAEFVRQRAEQWGVPVTVDQARLTAGSPGVEAQARRARYLFFAEVARQQGTHQVAVAHHADDQAETILLNIVRGAGLRGLRGMLPRTPMPYAPQITLVRPLLNIYRTEIDLYCQQHELEPRSDATNDDRTFHRNFVRHNIMPHLRTLNPQATAAINRLGANAALEDEYLQSELNRQTADHITRGRDSIRLQLEVYRSLHPVFQRRFVLSAAHELHPMAEIAQHHIDSALSIIYAGKTGTVAQLRQNVRLRVDYGHLVVERYTSPRDDSPHEVERSPLDSQGGEWRAEVSDLPPANGTFAAVRAPQGAQISLRTRQSGDRWMPAGLQGRSQKVQKWMIDRKIPRDTRDTLPLLIVNETIAAIFTGEEWVVGYGFTSQNSDAKAPDVIYIHLQKTSM